MHFKSTQKGIALLYVIVVIGVLSLAFVSITELGKARNLQVIAAQSKNRAYAALDAMMECAYGYDRTYDTWPNTNTYTCNGNTTVFSSGSNGGTSYRMLTSTIDASQNTCAQAIMYYNLEGSNLDSQGSKTTMFIRGFNGCKVSTSGVRIPNVLDPSFATVSERFKYKDFPRP